MDQIQRCSFVNLKRNRPCQMEVYRQEEKYCFFHLSLFKDLDQVNCPIDPSHTVLKQNLKDHLKKCNKLILQQELEINPWYSKDINLSQQVHEIPENKVRLQDLQQSDPNLFYAFLSDIPKYFQNAVNLYQVYLQEINIQQQDVYNYLLDDTIQQKIDISFKEKDLQQVILLTKIMADHDLLSHSYSYIEYGAGKGRFSHQVADQIELKDKLPACHVLIEREVRSNKFDKFHRKNPFFMRQRIDIQHFKLANLQNELQKLDYFQIKGGVQDIQYIGICKHMCGGATDLTLNSLFSQGPKLRGFVIATCCHHLCDLKTYNNLEFLKSIGLANNLLMVLLFQSSSWYVSGAINQSSSEETLSKKVKLDSEQRTHLGKMAKRIIDIGRVLFYRKGILKKYCEQSQSPENFVLIHY